MRDAVRVEERDGAEHVCDARARVALVVARARATRSKSSPPSTNGITSAKLSNPSNTSTSGTTRVRGQAREDRELRADELHARGVAAALVEELDRKLGRARAPPPPPPPPPPPAAPPPAGRRPRRRPPPPAPPRRRATCTAERARRGAMHAPSSYSSPNSPAERPRRRVVVTGEKSAAAAASSSRPPRGASARAGGGRRRLLVRRGRVRGRGRTGHVVPPREVGVLLVVGAQVRRGRAQQRAQHALAEAQARRAEQHAARGAGPRPWRPLAQRPVSATSRTWRGAARGGGAPCRSLATYRKAHAIIARARDAPRRPRGPRARAARAGARARARRARRARPRPSAARATRRSGRPRRSRRTPRGPRGSTP